MVSSKKKCKAFKNLAVVVQSMDSTIHWLNLYHVDNATGLIFLVVVISCFHGALKSSYELVETCPCVPDRIGIWKCWFLRPRRENRSTQRKTSRSKGENQQHTQPTYGVDARIRTRATLLGREREIRLFKERNEGVKNICTLCCPVSGHFSLTLQ